MLKPGTLVSRTAALAILAVVLIAAYRLIAGPIIERYAATETRIAQSALLLQRYRTLADERQDLADRVSAAEAQGETTAGYWQGSSDALVAAKLQDRAAGSVAAHDGTIKSIQTLPASDLDDVDGIRRAELRVRFAADIEGLAAIMHDIETATPYLFIDQLSISRGNARRRSNGASVDAASELDVKLGLSGFLRARQ